MKILAVDDDDLSLDLLSNFIEKHGDHDLVTAKSAYDAIKIIHKHGLDYFDFLFVDIKMPEMNGTEFTSYIRKTLQLRDVPVIMLTAMVDKDHIDAAFAAGATDYVTKPFDGNDLRGRLSLIERLIGPEKSIGKAGDHQIAFEDPIGLGDPVTVFDVDNVIDHTSMENYALQLSRSAAFGSSTFAFAVRDIARLHQELSPYEFHSLISDVAEVLSDAMDGNQFLMSYAGCGVFVCVAERGWTPDIRRLEDRANLFLSQTELFKNDGERLFIRVSVGKSVRFVWKSGQSVLDALAKAHDYADNARTAFMEGRNDFWIAGQIA